MLLFPLPLLLRTGLLGVMLGAPGDMEAGERERPRWRRMTVGISLEGLGATAEEGVRALRGARERPWSSW